MQMFNPTTALKHWLFMRRPTERERTECVIKAKLRNIMMFQDLENITSKEVCVKSTFAMQMAMSVTGLHFDFYNILANFIH